MSVLAFPFRLTASGAAATVTEGSDAEAAQAIAMLALTEAGERWLCQGFGINPAGDIPGQVRTGLRLWGPAGVSITGGAVSIDADTGVKTVTVTFEVDEVEQ